MEDRSTSHPSQIIINSDLRTSRGRNTFISCLSRMGVVLKEHICFQDTKCPTDPDKPISNLPCSSTPYTR